MGMRVIHEHPREPEMGITLAQMAVGVPFRHPDGDDIYVRLSQTWFGNCCTKGRQGELLCFNLNNASIYSYRPSKRVIPVDAVIMHRGDL